MEALPRRSLADFIDGLALVECIHEGSRATEIQDACPQTKQVIVQSHQLGKDGPNVYAARRKLDPQ